MKRFNNSFATLKLREEVDEESVTGAGEAYLPGLDVPEKKYKGVSERLDTITLDDFKSTIEKYQRGLRRKDDVIDAYSKLSPKDQDSAKGYMRGIKEDVLSGYKQNKGFRAGHTKDTGGFQYDDLWNVNEESKEYEEGSEVRVTKKGDIHYNDKGTVLEVGEGTYTVKFKDDTTGIYQASHLTKPESVKDFEDKPELKLDEDFDDEIVPERIIKFAQRKGIEDVVNKVAEWVQKAGKRIVDGNAVGKNYGTLILDLTDKGGEIRITDGEDIEVNGQLVYDYQSFVEALGGESLQENYSRFKKETVTRSKEQQMHEAMKLVRKKLHEADKVMTYVKTMKEELGLQEYKSHTSRLMEKLQVSISEIYKKYKQIK